MNYFTDSSEWRTLFKQAMDWDTIIPLYYPTFPTAEGFKDKNELLAFFEELLSSTGKWSAETLCSRAREMDELGGGTLVDGKVEVSEALKKTYQEVKEMELIGLPVGTEHGGMGLPVSIAMIGFSNMSRGCIATGTQIGFFTVIAEMIERFCESDLQKKYIPRIVRGEISGSMCMTEPDAGSDVGAVRTTAEKQQDGTYLLNGNKLFIQRWGRIGVCASEGQRSASWLRRNFNVSC